MPFLKAEIARALRRDEFFPVFQPLVELRTGQLVGFEVLARWQHPTLGFILPPEFIPLAEKHGLIDLLSQQVLVQSFEPAKLLPLCITLAMNVTPKQLHDLGLPNRIVTEAASAGFSLNRLKVAITETAHLST